MFHTNLSYENFHRLSPPKYFLLCESEHLVESR